MSDTVSSDQLRAALVHRRELQARAQRSHLALHPVAETGEGPQIQWHDRQIEDYGTLHRIELPVAGAAGLPTARALATELERLWVQRRTLAPAADVTSVAVEIPTAAANASAAASAPAGTGQLVLLVTAPTLPLDDAETNARMGRDLRGAIRRGGAAPAGAPALVVAS